jgi:hypothetical protein
MLIKLLKHEMKATGRIMWVIYAAMGLLSVLANLSFHMADTNYNQYLRAVSKMTLVLWVLSLIIGVVITVVLMVRQFQKNLLTDEGYLAFTLPVSVHQLVLSKLMVAVLWFIVTALAVALSVFIATLSNSMLEAMHDFFKGIVHDINAYNAVNVTVILGEMAILAIVGCAVSSLQFYSAMSIGYGFTNHKALWSVLTYFGIQIVLQLLAVLVATAVDSSGISTYFFDFLLDLDFMGWMHMVLISGIISMGIVGAIFYGITLWNLKHRLNLA